MKQSERSIKRSIKYFRKIIDSPVEDTETKRMAYFAETILRWSIEDTKGWERPEDELRHEVRLLKSGH